jgi:hypothetical protein
MMLCSFISMMTSMSRVTMRSMGVMSTLLWCACLVMFRCFAMVVSSVRVMLGGFRMMLGAFVRHSVSSIGREKRQRHASCCSYRRQLRLVVNVRGHLHQRG